MLALLASMAVTTALAGDPVPYFRGRGGRAMESVQDQLKTSIPAKFSVDADFDVGKLVNLNHDDVHDQLQLDNKSTAFNFIWIPCSGLGTLLKIDTISGHVLGAYRTTPENQQWGDPSRTTVDHDGSVWLSNRADVYNSSGSVIHIGLNENNQCHDRNNNGVIDTSTGIDDVRSWDTLDVNTAEDECIVHYTKVNSLGTRHVSVDAKNDVWVSGYSLQNFDLIKGGKFDIPGSGTIIRSEESVDYGGYGGLVGMDGVIWSAAPLLRWNPVGNLTAETY